MLNVKHRNWAPLDRNMNSCKAARVSTALSFGWLLLTITAACGITGNSTAQSIQPSCNNGIPKPADQQLGAAQPQNAPQVESMALTDETTSAETGDSAETGGSAETGSGNTQDSQDGVNNFILDWFNERSEEPERQAGRDKAPSLQETTQSVKKHESQVAKALAHRGMDNEAMSQAMSHTPCIPEPHTFSPTDATQETGVSGRSSPNEATSNGSSPVLPTHPAVSDYGTDLKTKAGQSTKERVDRLDSNTDFVRNTTDPADITQGTGTTVNGLSENGCSGPTMGTLGIEDNGDYIGCTGTRAGNQ